MNPSKHTFSTGLAGTLEAAGLMPTQRMLASVEVPVWTLALELEQPQDLKPHERAVLGLVAAGVGSSQKQAALLGLGSHPEVVHRALARLALARLVVCVDKEWTITTLGEASVASGSAPARVSVEADLTLHPSRGAAVWSDGLRGGAADNALRVEPVAMARVWPTQNVGRVAALVDRDGVPAGLGAARHSAVSRPVLVGLSVRRVRRAWFDVEVEEWRDPSDARVRYIAYTDAAEDAELTAWFEAGNPVIIDGVARLTHGLDNRAAADPAAAKATAKSARSRVGASRAKRS